MDSNIRSENVCEKFEDSIRYDAHGLTSKVHRSEAGRKLQGMEKKEALVLITAHLEKNLPSDDHMKKAWSMLIFLIMTKNDGGDAQTPNLGFTNLAGWIAWAKEHI